MPGMLTAETTHTVVNDGVQIFCGDYGTPAPAGATRASTSACAAPLRFTRARTRRPRPAQPSSVS